jgi:hypothetical protein
MVPKVLAERVGADHAEVHVLAIAPFTVGDAPQKLEIAATVDKAFIYRHSVTPTARTAGTARAPTRAVANHVWSPDRQQLTAAAGDQLSLMRAAQPIDRFGEV